MKGISWGRGRRLEPWAVLPKRWRTSSPRSVPSVDEAEGNIQHPDSLQMELPDGTTHSASSHLSRAAAAQALWEGAR